MRFVKLNWSTCLVIMFSAIIFSCEEDKLFSTDKDSSDEVYILEPDLSGDEEEITTSARTASTGTLNAVLVYLNREEFAVGKFRIRVARASDNVLVLKSVPVDVSVLPIHSKTSKVYKIMKLNIGRTVDTGVEYKIELICEECLPENKRRVHWWYSIGNDDYTEGDMYTTDIHNHPTRDFSFYATYQPLEGEAYRCAFNYNLEDVYAFNFGEGRVSQRFRIGTPIEFADDDLKRSAQNNLGFTYDQSVMTYDALSITEFHDEYLIIEDLGGIEYFKNLTKLELKLCQLTNIDPIANLTNLEYLDLSYNNIEDVESLKALTNLQYLNLEGNTRLTTAEVRSLEQTLGIDVIF